MLALLAVLLWPRSPACSTRSGSIAVARPSRVAVDDDALEPDAALGGPEAHRHAGTHPPDRELRLHADHRVVRAGHACVGDRRRAAGLHAGVARLHVRVRPEHRRHAAVEPAGERDLLARRLRVEVDDDERALGAGLLDEVVDHLEEAGSHVEEERAEQVDHRDRRAVGRRRDRERPAGRAGGDVRRPDHAFRGSEVRADVVARPDVVAERDHVGAGREQLVGELRRDPAPVGRVLAVDDAERRRRAPRAARAGAPRPRSARPCRRRRRERGFARAARSSAEARSPRSAPRSRRGCRRPACTARARAARPRRSRAPCRSWTCGSSAVRPDRRAPGRPAGA